MLKIIVKGIEIEKALKVYKNKLVKIKQMKKLNDLKQFEKLSHKKRKEKIKAKYKNKKKGEI